MRKADIEWQGEDSVADIVDGLIRFGRIELLLPVNFNHALFAHFYPDAVPGVEALDVYGGAEVIRRAAEVDGLEELQALVQPLVDASAQVRIISPPCIVISCDESGKPLS